jgi:serine/threonine protein kinase
MSRMATEQPRAVWCCSTCGAIYHKDFPRCPADGAEVVMTDRDPMLGAIVGHYTIARLVGEGGMGRVYLARQLDLGRQVVVKVMHDKIAADTKFRERFERETLLMAQFQHPHAVTLYDASLNDPLGPCIIMEYVRGVNLEQLLAKNGRFSAPRLGRLVGQLCDVLQAAHDAGIVHRDLKPANLMVVDADSPRERLKVMDFGLAKDLDASAFKKVTDANVDFAVGTPGYICPEQVLGDEMDQRGDLYSVGVVLYELLTGRLPFTGPTSLDMLMAHAHQPPPTFAEVEVTDVPPAVEEVVMACLAKDPAHRPQSARELGERYEQALSDPPALLPAGATPSSVAPDQPFAPTFTSPPDDPNAIVFTFEAWMPEKVAVVKLRGFVQDMRGQVIESVPGLIRVLLPSDRSSKAGPPSGRLSWFGLIRRSGPIHMELRLQQLDTQRENLLHVDALFRPGDPSTPATDPQWRARCVAIYLEIRGYLMG